MSLGLARWRPSEKHVFFLSVIESEFSSHYMVSEVGSSKKIQSVSE